MVSSLFTDLVGYSFQCNIKGAGINSTIVLSPQAIHLQKDRYTLGSELNAECMSIL